MQDVPLFAGAKSRAGAKVVDYALDVTTNRYGRCQNLVPIRHACNFKSGKSPKPEGIMWRQTRLILRNATGFTESANSWVVAHPEGILGPNKQTVLGTAPVAERNQASFRLPR